MGLWYRSVSFSVCLMVVVCKAAEVSLGAALR